MVQDTATFVMSQLAGQLPLLVVYLVAGVLAIVFMGRARTASLLALCGAVVLVLTAIVVIASSGIMFQAMRDGRWSHEQFGRAQAGLGILGACARAFGTSLLVAAVFVGRKRAVPGQI